MSRFFGFSRASRPASDDIHQKARSSDPAKSLPTYGGFGGVEEDSNGYAWGGRMPILGASSAPTPRSGVQNKTRAKTKVRMKPKKVSKYDDDDDDDDDYDNNDDGNIGKAPYQAKVFTKKMSSYDEEPEPQPQKVLSDTEVSSYLSKYRRMYVSGVPEEAIRSNANREGIVLDDNFFTNISNDPAVREKEEQQANFQQQQKRQDLSEVLSFRRAYEQAIANGDPQPWGWSKLMIIGQGAAGKTSTVRSLLGLPPVMEWESTVGVDLKVTSADDWKERDHSETDFSLMLHKAAVEIVKKEENANGGSSARNAVKSIRNSVRNTSRGSGVVGTMKKFIGMGRRASSRGTDVAETTDLDLQLQEPPAEQDPVVLNSLLEDEDVARSINLDWARKLKDSSDTPLRFAIWDYGGQEVFYALHHIFLTRYGVYVLVFDMRQILSDTEHTLSYMHFWLSSVKLHAPSAPIVIVGTYADEIASVDEHIAIESLLRGNLNASLLTQVVKDPEAMLSYFPMNNASQDPLRGAKLRHIIETRTAEQAYVKQKISLRWIKILTELVEETGLQYVPLARVRSIAGTYAVTGGELSHMLRFFNEIGALVYLDANENLRRNVVTQPQWLLNRLSRIISDEKHVEKLYYDPELQQLGLADDFDHLRTTGVASYRLLEYLWEGEEVDFLIEFMNSSMLLSPWTFEGKKEYLVTSLLRENSDELAASANHSLKAIDKTEFIGGPACALDFSEFFLPDGVFQRLVPLCAAYSARDEDSATPRLSRHTAQISFGWTDFLLEAQPQSDRILITFKHDAPGIPESIKLIVSMFRELKDNVMQNLKWKLVLFAFKTSPTTSGDLQSVKYEDLESAHKRKVSKVRDVHGKAAQLSDFSIFLDCEEQLGSLVRDESSPTSSGVSDVTDVDPTSVDQNVKKGFDIFISHKQSTGGDQVAMLYEKLTQRGFRVWYDEKMPIITKPSMEEGVMSASCFLLFLSRDVFKSGYVAFELQTALKREKPVLMVHESDTQRLSYADFDEYLHTAPTFVKEANLFEEVESMAFQRRYYLEKGFLDELVHRIEMAIAPRRPSNSR